MGLAIGSKSPTTVFYGWEAPNLPANELEFRSEVFLCEEILVRSEPTLGSFGRCDCVHDHGSCVGGRRAVVGVSIARSVRETMGGGNTSRPLQVGGMRAGRFRSFRCQADATDSNPGVSLQNSEWC